MSEWYYIGAAYTLTYLVLAGYALRLRALRRAAVRAFQAERREGGYE
jgi:hypothetical protein